MSPSYPSWPYMPLAVVFGLQTIQTLAFIYRRKGYLFKHPVHVFVVPKMPYDLFVCITRLFLVADFLHRKQSELYKQVIANLAQSTAADVRFIHPFKIWRRADNFYTDSRLLNLNKAYVPILPSILHGFLPKIKPVMAETRLSATTRLFFIVTRIMQVKIRSNLIKGTLSVILQGAKCSNDICDLRSYSRELIYIVMSPAHSCRAMFILTPAAHLPTI
jgi:hypothetical protein